MLHSTEYNRNFFSEQKKKRAKVSDDILTAITFFFENILQLKVLFNIPSKMIYILFFRTQYFITSDA